MITKTKYIQDAIDSMKNSGNMPPYALITAKKVDVSNFPDIKKVQLSNFISENTFVLLELTKASIDDKYVLK